MANKQHHRGAYAARAAAVRHAANASALTVCWRCGRTAAQHPPHRNGRPGHWQAGHVRDGDPTSPLLPEWSTCNTSEGGKRGAAVTNARRWSRSTVAW